MFGSLLLQIRLSSVCLSVCLSCNVCVIYSVHWNFQQYFFSILYLSHPFTSMQHLQRSSQGNPTIGGIKHNRGSKIERCWTYRRLYLILMSRLGISPPGELFVTSMLRHLYGRHLEDTAYNNIYCGLPQKLTTSFLFSVQLHCYVWGKCCKFC